MSDAVAFIGQYMYVVPEVFVRRKYVINYRKPFIPDADQKPISIIKLTKKLFRCSRNNINMESRNKRQMVNGNCEVCEFFLTHAKWILSY